jgi:DNA-binding NarL/FixJ family response regulator
VPYRRRIYFGVRQLPVLRAALKAADLRQYELAGFFDEPPFDCTPAGPSPQDIWIVDFQMLRSVLQNYPENYADMSRSGFIVVAARRNDLSRLWSFEGHIDGIVVVEMLAEHLGDAILLATSRHSALAPEMIPSRHDIRHKPDAVLEEDEQTAFRLLAQGMTNKEIAAAMDLPSETVKALVRRLLAKLGFRNRTEAAVSAARSNPQAPA